MPIKKNCQKEKTQSGTFTTSEETMESHLSDECKHNFYPNQFFCQNQ